MERWILVSIIIQIVKFNWPDMLYRMTTCIDLCLFKEL